jgi:hypothetical protein
VVGERVLCVSSRLYNTKMVRLGAALLEANHEVGYMEPDWSTYYDAWVRAASYRYETFGPSVVVGHGVGALIASGAIYLSHRRSGCMGMPPRLILASPTPYTQDFVDAWELLPERGAKIRSWLRQELAHVSLVEVMQDVRHEIGRQPVVIHSAEPVDIDYYAADLCSLRAAQILGVERQIVKGTHDDISHPAYITAIINAMG